MSFLRHIPSLNGTKLRRLGLVLVAVNALGSVGRCAETNPFFALFTAVDGPPEVVVPMLEDLGYDGFSGLAGDRTMADALARAGMRFFNGYYQMDLHAGRPALDDMLRAHLDAMEGIDTSLWLTIRKVHSNGIPLAAGAPEGDAIAVAQIKEIADYAWARGVRVSLFHHRDFWLGRFEDTLRLADRLQHPAVSVTFSLNHWLKVEGSERDPTPLLLTALPRLTFVTINGSDTGDTRTMSLERRVQPLGEGSYDVAAFLRTLWRMGYTGPIGFQGYGIKAPPREVLAKTMTAWKRMQVRANDGAVLQVEKKGSELLISARLPKEINEVELRIESGRNEEISKITDISPHNPQRAASGRRNSAREIWYPVVDVVVEPGMEGVAEFEGDLNAECKLGGPFYTSFQPLEPQVIIPAHKLQYWENDVFVRPATKHSLTRFYLRQRQPVVVGRLERACELLSEDWSGRISLHAVTEGKNEELAAAVVVADSGSEYKANKTLDEFRGKGITRERLLASLDASAEFTLACQNTNPRSPTYGGPFLFYDLDARLYRTSYWMWGWGPSVSMLLGAAKVPEVASRLGADRLTKVADDIGRASLKFQVVDEDDPGHGLAVASWSMWGHQLFVTATDLLFLAKWGWIPLYEATGDSSYLEATKRLAHSTERLMEQFDIIPSIYHYGTETWSDYVLEESGFGTEGLAAVFRVTGDERYKRIGIRFMEQHLEKFQLENGLWNKNWNRVRREAIPPAYVTRGLGWAMEGLLASNEMEPNGRYLDYAKRMAVHLMEWQQEEGYWTFHLNKPEGEFGALEISDKGTALWCLLFYRLYDATHDERYLQTARRALEWLLDQQYAGDDREAYGSIVGLSRVSGVGYRQWYHMSCVYTSGFFGLAVLEELRVLDAASHE